MNERKKRRKNERENESRRVIKQIISGLVWIFFVSVCVYVFVHVKTAMLHVEGACLKAYIVCGAWPLGKCISEVSSPKLFLIAWYSRPGEED